MSKSSDIVAAKKLRFAKKKTGKQKNWAACALRENKKKGGNRPTHTNAAGGTLPPFV